MNKTLYIGASGFKDSVDIMYGNKGFSMAKLTDHFVGLGSAFDTWTALRIRYAVALTEESLRA